MKLPLRYTVRKRRASISGQGETCDISSLSLRFTPDAALPAKALIELSIDWPAATSSGEPIHLAVFGTILRCNSRGVVVLIGRYTFRPPVGGPSPAGTDSARGPDLP